LALRESSLKAAARPAQRKTIACALVICALAVAFMGESLLPDRMLAPLDIVMDTPPWSRTEYRPAEAYDILPTDKVFYIHPIKVLVGRAWRGGEIPLWEPRLLAGYPIIGNAQAGIFYPLTLPYVFLSGADASDLVALLHLIAAGLGMLGYLRAIGCRHLAALLGAIVFMLNEVSVVWLMWDSAIGAMVWLPWALWAFEASLRPGRFRAAALGGVAVALIVLGGHLQWSLYGLFAAACYASFRFAWPNGGSRRRVAAAACVILGAGVALATLQILPTLEYVRDGHRGPVSYEYIQSLVRWQAFVTLWTPRFFGMSTPRHWGGADEFWGPINYNESVIYVGIAPLLLAVAAIALRRDARVWFFAALGAFGALCAAGTDMYRLLFWLPGFDSVLPARFRYWVVVALAVLSALGLDRMLDRLAAGRPPRARALIWIPACLCAVYALMRIPALPVQPDHVAYLRRQELIAIAFMIASSLMFVGCAWFPKRGVHALTALCALTVIDLWLPGVANQRPVSTRFYFPATPGIEFLASDPDRFRILSVKTERWFDWELRPNTASLFDLQDAAGYDSVYDRRYAIYLERADPRGVPYTSSAYLSASRFDSPLVDLLDVKYALSNQPETPAGWELAHTGDLRIFRRTQPLPRAWIVDHAEVVADDAAMLARLTAPEFDPRHTVLLERPPPERSAESGAQPAGSVAIDRYENTRLVLSAQMDRAGWLVLSEMFHPGWRVTVDGVSADVYCANYLLRALPLARGRHTIEMRFLPTSFVSGAAISAAAAAFLLGVAIFARA
jgi:hypothetical protein